MPTHALSIWIARCLIAPHILPSMLLRFASHMISHRTCIPCVFHLYPHGIQNILPATGTVPTGWQLRDGMVEPQWVFDLWERTKPKGRRVLMLVLLDACHSGANVTREVPFLFASPNTPVVLEQPGTAIRRCRRRAVYAVFGRSRRNAGLIQHRAIACCGVRSILGLLVDMQCPSSSYLL